MKQFIKSLIPPILINILSKIRNKKYGWKGEYASWEEAKKTSTGYDTKKILITIKQSLLKVKNNDAVYERDSVIFDKIHYSWPLLAILMLSAIKTGELKVLDFGGSLGSTYFQNKKFLDEIQNVSWNIVEQKHFVEVGKKEFENDRLKFYYTISDCFLNVKPNILLLSSVLQYMENPYKVINDIIEYNFNYIVIDRTPFCVKNQDTIKLQVVSPSIYEASYPCWFFNESKLKKSLSSKNYILMEEFETIPEKANNYYFKGMIWRKNV